MFIKARNWAESSLITKDIHTKTRIINAGCVVVVVTMPGCWLWCPDLPHHELSAECSLHWTLALNNRKPLENIPNLSDIEMRRLEQNKDGCSGSDQMMPPLQPTPALSIICHPQCHGRLPAAGPEGSCWSYTGWVLTLSDLGKCRGDKQKSARVHVSVIQMIGSIVCLSCGPVAGLMVQ